MCIRCRARKALAGFKIGGRSRIRRAPHITIIMIQLSERAETSISGIIIYFGMQYGFSFVKSMAPLGGGEDNYYYEDESWKDFL